MIRSTSHLAAAFPYHIAMDRSGRALEVGSACVRLALCVPGDAIADRFFVQRGPAVLSDARPDELVELLSRETGLVLAGPVVPANREDVVVFLGPPAGADVQPSGLPEELRHLLDVSPGSVVVADTEGLIRFWNRSAEALFGREAAAVVGRPLVDILVPESYRAAHQAGFAHYLAFGEARVLNRRLSLRALHASGSEIPVELTITTGRWRDRPAFIGFLRDDRDRRNVEAGFLARVSHELRTPLNAILGMTGLALDEAVSTRVREYLTIARHAGSSLLDLVNDVLDFSRIDAGKLELEPQTFNLGTVVEETAEMFFRDLEAKQLAFGLYLDPRLGAVSGDPGRVRQVLVNLLGNAVKYTDTGWITIEVESEGDHVRIAIADSGIGIDDAAQARLFQPFAQVHPVESKKRGGTGLGLAISSELARMMDGGISIESIPGRGSRFVFRARLPHAAASTPPAPLAGTEVVLLMAANPARAVLARQIEAWGARVVFRAEPRPESAPPAPRAAPRGARQVVLLGSSLGTRNLRAGDTATMVVITEPPRPTRLLAMLSPAPAGEVRAPLTASSLAALAPRVRAGTRILVVEDNAANQRTLVWLLKRWDLRVDVAGDGIEAIEAVARVPYDLVIMDCQMPRMGGVEATIQIRRAEAGSDRHVPIVALTANAFREDRERCLRAGMDDYFTKPLEPHLLSGVIERFVAAGPPAPPAPVSEPTPVVATVSVPDGIDYPRVVERLFAGSLEGYLEISSVFYASSMKLEEKLAAAIQAGDRSQAARVAHQLAGAAGNVGAVAASTIARRLEEVALSEGQPAEAVRALVPELSGQLARFRGFVDRLRAV